VTRFFIDSLLPAISPFVSTEKNYDSISFPEELLSFIRAIYLLFCKNRKKRKRLLAGINCPNIYIS